MIKKVVFLLIFIPASLLAGEPVDNYNKLLGEGKFIDADAYLKNYIENENSNLSHEALLTYYWILIENAYLYWNWDLLTEYAADLTELIKADPNDVFGVALGEYFHAKGKLKAQGDAKAAISLLKPIIGIPFLEAKINYSLYLQLTTLYAEALWTIGRLSDADTAMNSILANIALRESIQDRDAFEFLAKLASFYYSTDRLDLATYIYNHLINLETEVGYKLTLKPWYAVMVTEIIFAALDSDDLIRAQNLTNSFDKNIKSQLPRRVIDNLYLAKAMIAERNDDVDEIHKLITSYNNLKNKSDAHLFSMELLEAYTNVKLGKSINISKVNKVLDKLENFESRDAFRAYVKLIDYEIKSQYVSIQEKNELAHNLIKDTLLAIKENVGIARSRTISFDYYFKKVFSSILVDKNKDSYIETNSNYITTLFEAAQVINGLKSTSDIQASVAQSSIKDVADRFKLRIRERMLHREQDYKLEFIERIVNLVKANIGKSVEEQKIGKFSAGEYFKYSKYFRILNETDKWVKRKYPDYFLESRLSLIELSEIKKHIRDDEMLIFQIGAAGSLATFCISNSDEKYYVNKIKDVHKLKESAFNVRQSLVDTTAVKLDKSSFPFKDARFLYDTFFKQIESCLNEKKKVIYIPDPITYGLPFNVFLAGSEGGLNINNKIDEYEWFGIKHAVSYLPAPGYLAMLRENNRQYININTFLGVGDPAFNNVVTTEVNQNLSSLFIKRGLIDSESLFNLPRLKDSKDEIISIKNIIGDGRSTIILGENATEEAIHKEKLNKYDLIDFATHGLLAGESDGKNEPGLAFLPSDNPRGYNYKDGLLTASEIADKRFAADLVILSACNTANASGDPNIFGLSELSKAFFTAGVDSLAVTQWSVFSESAKEISTHLVDHIINKNMSPATALRAAMRIIEGNSTNQIKRHPKYWAPFIIIGDGFQIPAKNNTDKISTYVSVIVEKKWSYEEGYDGYDEIFSIKKSKDNQFVYISGITSKGQKEGIATGKLQKFDRMGNLIDNQILDIGAPMIIGIDEDYNVILTGYQWSDEKKSDAVIRKLDDKGEILWEWKLSTELDEFISDAIVSKHDKNTIYALVKKEDYSKNSIPIEYNIVKVNSRLGKTVESTKLPVDTKLKSINRNLLFEDVRGNINVVVNGYKNVQIQGSTFKINDDLTVSNCLSNENAHLTIITPNSLIIDDHIDHKNTRIVDHAIKDDQDYVLLRKNSGCRFSSDGVTELVELHKGNFVKTMYKAEYLFDQNPRGLLLLSNGDWVIGGGISYPINIQKSVTDINDISQYTEIKIIREDNATTDFLTILNSDFKQIYNFVGSDLSLGLSAAFEQGHKENEFFVGGVTRGTDSKLEYYSIH